MAKKAAAKIDTAVQETLAKLDVDMVGVVRIEKLKDEKIKAAALKLLPSVKSIVALGMEVFPEFLNLTASERKMGTTNFNNLLSRHVDYLRGRLLKASYDIANASHRAGLKALPLTGQGPAVDGRFLEAVISYKHTAQEAGLGNIGMSSLLVTEKYGPRVQLNLCLTEASLESTAGETQKNCRYCNICIGKCPAKALGRPKPGEVYVINKFACRNYVEAAGGCSECMRVCPVASPIYK
ncbi:MAG: 4Fe-4S binding protein [Dehalococcoidales bacterium]